MKIGIVGKGGVGKTTVSALLAQSYVRARRRVVVIDTDSNPNLGISLGLTAAEVDAVPALPRSLLVGTDGGTTADRLIADYGRDTPAGAVLLSAIRVNEAGAGCTCGGHATVRSMLGDVLSDSADVTLIDMEAGLEHLSRSGGTLAYADALLVVTEPSRKSVLTAARTLALAEELGIPRTYTLGNKARLPEDEAFFRETSAEYGVELIGVLPHSQDVVHADRAGSALGSGSKHVLGHEIDGVAAFLERQRVS